MKISYLILEQLNTHRNDIYPGQTVDIILKKDQKTGKLTRGVVSKILTNKKIHSRGIKVKLKDGQVGRVQRIIIEGLEDLHKYNLINKYFRAANNNYKNAIHAHNNGDVSGFINNLNKHQQNEISLHTLLAHPTFLRGSHKIESRRLNSINFLNTKGRL